MVHGLSSMVYGLSLSCIRPELQLPGEERFNSKDQQQADAGCSQNLDQEIEKRTEFQPFQQREVNMVQECHYKNIYHIGCPSHCPWRRFAVIEFIGILWNKNSNNERPGISNENTGCSMK